MKKYNLFVDPVVKKMLNIMNNFYFFINDVNIINTTDYY